MENIDALAPTPHRAIPLSIVPGPMTDLACNAKYRLPESKLRCNAWRPENLKEQQ